MEIQSSRILNILKTKNVITAISIIGCIVTVIAFLQSKADNLTLLDELSSAKGQIFKLREELRSANFEIINLMKNRDNLFDKIIKRIEDESLKIDKFQETLNDSENGKLNIRIELENLKSELIKTKTMVNQEIEKTQKQKNIKQPQQHFRGYPQWEEFGKEPM
jgi:hypothetical protein